MSTINDKVAHVRAAPDTEPGHKCHWPGCTRHCKPAQFSCTGHWYTWPKAIRDRIWAAYRVGQEESKTPSAAYLLAADAAEQWAIAYERERAAKQSQQGSLL